MPVKKTSTKKPRASAQKSTSSKAETPTCAKGHFLCQEMIGKIFITLFGVLIVYGIVFVGTLIRNNIQSYDYIGQADRPERLITIEAEGKITAKPDIATVSMGLNQRGATVAEAQEASSKIMNSLSASLKGLGIDEEDIQTANYNVYPQYRYTELEGQVIDGYNVSQNVTVKIRDIDSASQVLALVGELGLNQIGGLNFEIDDTEQYVVMAREKALKEVQNKADLLSSQLGVEIVGIVSYNEYNREDGIGAYPVFAEFDSRALGGAAPKIEEGSTDVVLNVSVTFEIR